MSVENGCLDKNDLGKQANWKKEMKAGTRSHSILQKPCPPPPRASVVYGFVRLMWAKLFLTKTLSSTTSAQLTLLLSRLMDP